jgi:hypothetical protein
VSPAALIEQAEQAGIVLTLADGQMVADAPEGEQADAVLDQLREHRLAVAAYLRRPRDPVEAGCAQPQNLARFMALARLDARERAGGR